MNYSLKWHPELNIKRFRGTDYSAMETTIELMTLYPPLEELFLFNHWLESYNSFKNSMWVRIRLKFAIPCVYVYNLCTYKQMQIMAKCINVHIIIP